MIWLSLWVFTSRLYFNFLCIDEKIVILKLVFCYQAELAVSDFSGDGAGILAAAGTIVSTFVLVFVAEWGDKSFFSTIGEFLSFIRTVYIISYHGLF